MKKKEIVDLKTKTDDLMAKIKKQDDIIAALRNKIDDLDKKHNNLKETVDFVLKYGKDGITFKYKETKCTDIFDGYLWSSNFYLKYLYCGEVCEVATPFYNIDEAMVIKKNPFTITIKRCVGDCVYYYLLNKENKTLTEIPKPAFVLEQELAENKETTKKDENTAKTETSKKTKNAKS